MKKIKSVVQFVQKCTNSPSLRKFKKIFSHWQEGWGLDLDPRVDFPHFLFFFSILNATLAKSVYCGESVSPSNHLRSKCKSWWYKGILGDIICK